MSDITREQAYRRWKKGEDQHDLAKEMGVTRERMRHILKKMDENVPLGVHIEELQAERDEALNQLDSARHSVEVLEANVARLRDALGKALERLEASAFTNAEHVQAAEIICAALQGTATDTAPKTSSNDASQ